jgi:hypothetical protein
VPIPNFDTSNIVDGQTIDAADVKAPLEALASAIEDLGALAARDTVGTNEIENGAITAAKLADSGATAGTYTHATVTVDAKGRILSASSGTPSTGGSSLPRVISNARTIESNEQVIVKEVKIDSNGTLIVKGLLYLL